MSTHPQEAVSEPIGAAANAAGATNEREAHERAGPPALLRWPSPEAWLRTAREIAIVTLGILIAFALNAWWEEQRERREEERHLHALASDFQQNAKILASLVEREDRVAEHSLKLLQAARAPEPASPEIIRSLMGQVFSSQRLEPVMGAYQALVNSAGLTLIRNDELRAALADFAALAGDRYGERFADELYFRLSHEFAGQLQFVADAVAPPSSPVSYAAVLEDPKFQEYLALRHVLEAEVANHYRDLQQRAEGILAKVQAEMR